MVQPEPRVTKGNWNPGAGGVLHPPPSLSPHWLNAAKQQLTQEPGKHSLGGPTHLRWEQGEVRSRPKSKQAQDYHYGPPAI